MRVLVAGTGRLGAAILEPLLESRHDVVGLLLNGRNTRGAFRRYYETREWSTTVDAPVRFARRRSIPIHWLDDGAEHAAATVAPLHPDLLITCGFGIILKDPLLRLPSIGCINVHSSLLPKHRGPMPFNWVILSGDTETGVTFHVTTANIDGGDVLDQRSIPVTEHDTAMTVYVRCCALARYRVVHVVDTIEAKGLVGLRQDERAATYDPPIDFEDLRIKWTNTAKEIDRVVRAGTPFFPAHFGYRGVAVDVLRSAVVEGDPDESPGTVVATEPNIVVATGEGLLKIVRASMTSPLRLPWPNVISRAHIGLRLE